MSSKNNNDVRDKKIDIWLIDFLQSMHYRVLGRTHMLYDIFGISLIVIALLTLVISIYFIPESNLLLFILHLLALFTKIISCFMHQLSLKQEYQVTKLQTIVVDHNTGEQKVVVRRSPYSIQLWVLVPSFVLVLLCAGIGGILMHGELGVPVFTVLFCVVTTFSVIVNFLSDVLRALTLLYNAQAIISPLD